MAYFLIEEVVIAAQHIEKLLRALARFKQAQLHSAVRSTLMVKRKPSS